MLLLFKDLMYWGFWWSYSYCGDANVCVYLVPLSASCALQVLGRFISSWWVSGSMPSPYRHLCAASTRWKAMLWLLVSCEAGVSTHWVMNHIMFYSFTDKTWVTRHSSWLYEPQRPEPRVLKPCRSFHYGLYITADPSSQSDGTKTSIFWCQEWPAGGAL